jgi:hypothetical protein
LGGANRSIFGETVDDLDRFVELSFANHDCLLDNLSDAEFHSRYPVYIGEAVQEGRCEEDQSGSAMPAMKNLKWALTRR